MKVSKTIAITILLSITLSQALPAYASASSDLYTLSNRDTRDITVEIRTKVSGGILYKRRWNVTNNCWIDSYWIPYSQPFPN